MPKYNFVFWQLYSMPFSVEADNKDEAESMAYEMLANDELEGMNEMTKGGDGITLVNVTKEDEKEA